MNTNDKNKLFHQITECFGWFITCTFLAIALYCLIGFYRQQQSGKLFFPFGYRPVVILSGSMEETLKTGSVVLVKETTNIDVNDIIFFLSEDKIPIIHRCMRITEDGYFITKGDANPTSDANPVAASQIVGKVVCAIPFLGYVISAIQSKTGIFLLVLFLIISLFSDILSEFKSQTKFQSTEKTGKESAFKTHKK